MISGRIKYSKMSSTRTKTKTNLFTSALLLNVKRKKKEPRRKLKRWNLNCILNYFVFARETNKYTIYSMMNTFSRAKSHLNVSITV